MREGFVPINIKFIDRKKYYEAFNAFDKNGATNIMEEIVGKALTNREFYSAGTWGPVAADDLLAQSGHSWHVPLPANGRPTEERQEAWEPSAS